MIRYGVKRSTEVEGDTETRQSSEKGGDGERFGFHRDILDNRERGC